MVENLADTLYNKYNFRYKAPKILNLPSTLTLGNKPLFYFSNALSLGPYVPIETLMFLNFIFSFKISSQP